jgi:hypothetical protein
LLTDKDGKTVNAASLREGSITISITDDERAILEKANIVPVAHTDATLVKDEPGMSYVLAIRTFEGGKEQIMGYLIGRIAWRSVEDILSRDNAGIDLFRSDGVLISSAGDVHQTQIQSSESILQFKEIEAAQLVTIGGVVHVKTLTREKGIPNYAGNRWILASVRDASVYIA